MNCQESNLQIDEFGNSFRTVNEDFLLELHHETELCYFL